MYKKIGFLLLTMTTLHVHAQRFGGTPPGVKWRQLGSDTARIIFPEGLEKDAQRVATIVHNQAANTPVALGSRVRTINIVLQNQTTIANGYVGLGPYRSEFYLTPSAGNFDQGSIPWTDQLALHEYRHVQQFNNFHNGLSQVMRVLFGEEGYALAINASVPNWFYEGDAVYSETILSNQGRGRLPQFMNAYPSLWLAEKKYSWMKLRNGSFKDYVPDHYNLGYLLVNYGYEKYGADFWAKVTKDASAFKGLFYPFQKAIEKYAGVSYTRFREEALDYYKNTTTGIAAATAAGESGPHPVTSLNKKVLTSYQFPYAVSPTATLYLKTSYNRRPGFVVRNADGKEDWLRVRDIAINDQYSYRNGRLVYAAYESDPRWRWRDYSVIRVMDVETHAQRTLTHKSRYFSPDISADGQRVVAVQNAQDGKSEMHVLATDNGEVLQRISNPSVMLFTDPKFIDDTSVVSALRLPDGRMTLARVSLQNSRVQPLTPSSFNVLGYPCVSDGYIYFTASFGGRDDIFRVPVSGGVISQMYTHWPLGNYGVNVAYGKISWSAFTADGYQLQQTDTAAVQWEPLPSLLTERLAITYPVANANEIQEFVPGHLKPRTFTSSRYRSGTRLFNFHSWRPYYEDPEFTFSLYGQNVLNTLETQIYYLYNENEKTHAAGVSAVYGKWFPYLNIGSQYTFARQEVMNNRLRTWDQLDTRIGLSVPLSWVKKQTSRQFTVGSNFYVSQDFNKGFFKDTLGNTSFTYLHHYVTFGEQVETAVQHFYPRLAYNLTLQFRHALTNYNSRQFLATGAVYFPGLAPTHNLYFNGAWQETGVRDVRFANRFPYSRGYNAAYFARIWGIRSNYHLPLLYPDWGFGNMLYLQRFRFNAFYDFSKAFDVNKRPLAFQRSVGGELFVDTKWWNQYELTFGFRVSHLLDTDFLTRQSGATVFEFIMPVSILPR